MGGAAEAAGEDLASNELVLVLILAELARDRFLTELQEERLLTTLLEERFLTALLYHEAVYVALSL